MLIVLITFVHEKGVKSNLKDEKVEGGCECRNDVIIDIRIQKRFLEILYKNDLENGHFLQFFYKIAYPHQEVYLLKMAVSVIQYNITILMKYDGKRGY